ncbi:unnamed protein product [Scytosiphon promiscuus]
MGTPSVVMRHPEPEGEGADDMARWMMAAALLTLGLCSAIVPPYGRYSRSVIFGIRFPLLDAKVGWCLMECPNVLMALWFLRYRSDEACRKSPVNLALLGMFVVHYVNRSFVFPFQMRGGRPMPLLVTLLAGIFCSANSYLQCSHLFSRVYPQSWFADPRFLIGSVMFALGMYINCHSDGILRRLREPGETGYKIPRGGMFEYVSGANFFGECVEWCGFAIAGWSLPASSFALYTIANLVPRARKHHLWYLEKFEDYPPERRALIPLLW